MANPSNVIQLGRIELNHWKSTANIDLILATNFQKEGKEKVQQCSEITAYFISWLKWFQYKEIDRLLGDGPQNFPRKSATNLVELEMSVANALRWSFYATLAFQSWDDRARYHCSYNIWLMIREKDNMSSSFNKRWYPIINWVAASVSQYHMILESVRHDAPAKVYSWFVSSLRNQVNFSDTAFCLTDW